MKMSLVSNSLNNISLGDKLMAKHDNSLKAEENKSFANMLKENIQEVNKQQEEAYKAMGDIATNKVVNLQDAVQQIEEAELTLKLAIETKSKALGAYKEIMRMQI